MLHRRRLLMAKLKREPNYDIMVWAATGYDGVVRLNGADFQLTQDTNDTELWYGTAPSSVTSMDYFSKHGAGSYYNSTSIYIKEVKFGTGMYAKTSNCTSLYAAFYCGGGVDTSLFSKIDVSNLNTSSVTNMQGVFADININTISNGVTIVGYEDWNTSNVTNFNYCFGSLFINNEIIDIHKWHVSSNATIVSMFGGLVMPANNGLNRLIYYTPGYWGKDPMNDSNLASDRVKPTVYPYHDITIAATSSFNGNVRINDTNIATTKDNNLGIWYYDIPSQGELTQINLSYGSSSKAYITSISIGDRFANQDALFNTWSAFADCASLRTVRIPEGLNVNLNQTFRGSGLSTPVLCGVYGFDKIKNQSQSGGEFLFRNQSNMYYVDLGPQTFTTYFNYAFYNCTNLRRISNFPGIENTVSATTPMTGCTNLTYIDASGPISKTISFADCPLNLNSAKVILSALQQVTSETISFSTTTWGYILADDEAIELLETAYSNGWNSNEPDIQVVAQSGYDGVVRLNGANKQLTNISGTEVWYGSAGTVTAMDDFLKHRNASGVYNSTSVNVKKIRFGKNINTASCTTLFAAFDCTSSDTTKFEKIDVTHINTQNVTNIRAVFADIHTTSNGVTIVGYEDWNTNNVTNFMYAFGSNYIKNEIIDIHKWHIKSGSSITNMFGGLNYVPITTIGVNRKVYYTPGYWEVDPMNDSNLAADRIKPTVYPYHNITIAATSSYNGNATIGGNTVTLSKDNTLGIWYYDGKNTNMQNFLLNNTYITSVSFKDSFYEDDVNFYRAFTGNTNLRSISFGDNGKLNIMSINTLLFNSNNVSCIYGLNNIVDNKLGTGYYSFSGCSNIRYLSLPIWDNINNNMNNFAYNCSNLLRINRFPGIFSGCNTTNTITGCTSLNRIDASGPISETISFADCPLNLASAKVILNALQTVTSETLTFSSTTKTAINGDAEALSLVATARSKGWTIPLN